MRLPKSLAALSALSLLSIAGAAQAQQKDAPIEYRFDDDDMVGSTLSSNLAILQVRPRLPHVTLIRPRASFVAELLTSVESL